MKNLIAIGALSCAIFLGAPFTASPVQAQTKAECRQHLIGYDRTSNEQARAAMRQRYQACLKAAKK